MARAVGTGLPCPCPFAPPLPPLVSHSSTWRGVRCCCCCSWSLSVSPLLSSDVAFLPLLLLLLRLLALVLRSATCTSATHAGSTCAEGLAGDPNMSEEAEARDSHENTVAAVTADAGKGGTRGARRADADPAAAAAAAAVVVASIVAVIRALVASSRSGWLAPRGRAQRGLNQRKRT